MSGLAQKLFLEHSSKNFSEEPEKKERWPLLEKMAAANRLDYVDLSLANQLLCKESSESAAALICHLSLAAKRGHICVKFENEILTPSIEEIWVGDQEEVSEKIFPEDEALLKQLIIIGTETSNLSLISEIQENSEEFYTPIIKHKKAFYLQRYWYLETLFLEGLKQKLLDPCVCPINDLKGIEEKILSLIAEGKLLHEQAEAILAVSQVPITLITGGPGTGKTYTAGHLIRLIWEGLDADEKTSFEIALAAPTGKAAANLQASMDNDDGPVIKAKTLHSLLGIKKNKAFYTPTKLTADLVIIDESSMIDIHMMGQLFQALKPGARLVLLGDRYQLPSIEAGSLFADLVSYFGIKDLERVKVVELKTCLRAELKSILEFGGYVKTGDRVAALSLLEKKPEGVSFMRLDPELKIADYQKQLLSEAVSHFSFFDAIPEDPMKLLKKFNSFRILTAMRKGPFGVEILNESIYQALKNKAEGDCFIVPIMVTSNHAGFDLFNGETGLLVKDHGQEYAIFPSRGTEGTIRRIPRILMPAFEYAYCLSIYKSQGSEFEHVLLLAAEGMQRFGREALYTGVTRAKKLLEIWSSPQVLEGVISISAVRQSGIADRL